MFVWHQENKNTSSKSQRHVSLLTKNLVSRNELREVENIGARDVNVFITNFLLQVRVFVFNLCLENYFNENSRVTCNKQLTSWNVLCTGLNSLVVCVKSPHLLLPRSFGFLTQTTPAYNPVRRTFYGVNYIYGTAQ